MLHPLEFRLQKILEDILQQAASKLACTLPPNSPLHLVVLCSGGKDSTALLCALNALANSAHARPLTRKINISALHFNHRTRPTENRDECNSVVRQCLQKGIELRIVNRDHLLDELLTGTLGTVNNFQQAARQWRQVHASQERKKWGNNVFVCSAHHAGDQVETILLHLLRGSGVNGLMGMQLANLQTFWLHPFLEVQQAEIFEYLAAKKLSWCEDSSNKKTDYTRNHLRLKVIPELTQINPNLEETMGRMAHNLRAFESQWAQGLFSPTLPLHEVRSFSGHALSARILLTVSSAEGKKSWQLPLHQGQSASANFLQDMQENLLGWLQSLQQEQWQNMNLHLQKALRSGAAPLTEVFLLKVKAILKQDQDSESSRAPKEFSAPADAKLIVQLSSEYLGFLIRQESGVSPSKSEDTMLFKMNFLKQP